mgnify:CR=1 FL=1
MNVFSFHFPEHKSCATKTFEMIGNLSYLCKRMRKVNLTAQLTVVCITKFQRGGRFHLREVKSYFSFSTISRARASSTVQETGVSFFKAMTCLRVESTATVKRLFLRISSNNAKFPTHLPSLYRIPTPLLPLDLSI